MLKLTKKIIDNCNDVFTISILVRWENSKEDQMEDFEKLGSFYLGRLYDLDAKKSNDNLLLYDSKDLVTHGVCVGMTGSGKTGLCINILEEAAIDGIPSIIIDPKGDLANLLLTFPALSPSDFLPWINEEDALKKNLTAQAYAEEQAALWKKGLESWGQNGDRIQRLRDSSDFTIYTPGSNAGFPISILNSFKAPPKAILEDTEALRDQINTTVTSLLGLLGIEADPIKSQEHILISTLLDLAWKNDADIDLQTLIQQIQTPPITKIGVLDLESFFPSKDRFQLSLLLNNLLAAPGFSNWLEGDPLDIGSLLHTKTSKPRVTIFSIAHLNDAERMFFVSLLLNQIVGWMRTQSGTTSLRAIIYMDEIFGYFPPIANPPSKTPLLTLLKQGRAFGVGVLLVTQNPVDLDYKGLANAGTWFIGRLQTERDKARLIDGLEGSTALSGIKFNRQEIEKTIAGLGNRIFLMNNVHEDTPAVFESRWAMSYLRGPLTRNQIKVLCDAKKSLEGYTINKSTPDEKSKEKPVDKVAEQPLLPPDVDQYFAPIRGSQPSGQTLIYRPVLVGSGKVYYSDSKLGIKTTLEAVYQTYITNDPIPVDWEKATQSQLKISDLEKKPIEPCRFGELSLEAFKVKNYDSWNKDFANWLFRSQKLELFKSPSLNIYSQPNETERDFRIRLTQSSRELRDQALEKLREKYAPKIATLQEQIRKSQQAVERESAQAKQQKMQTVISIGATLLGAFAGRKVISQSTIGRASTSIKNASRTMKETEDINRAKDTVEAMTARLAQLEADFQADTKEITDKIDLQTGSLENIVVQPSKTDISVQLVTLCWIPYWQGTDGMLTPAQ